MLQFMRAGGVPIWFVLLFSVITLGYGALNAWRPDERKLGFLRAMTATTLFAILTAVTTNLAAVFTKVPAHPEWYADTELSLVVMIGLGEALTPAILGFTVLSLAWLLVAVGIRRL